MILTNSSLGSRNRKRLSKETRETGRIDWGKDRGSTVTSLYTGEVLSWFGPAFQPVMLGVLSELMESMKTYFQILIFHAEPSGRIWLAMVSFLNTTMVLNKHTWIEKNEQTWNIKVVVPNIYFKLGRTGRLVELGKLWVLPYSMYFYVWMHNK